MDAWFTLAAPPVTLPSSGIMEPMRTMMVSPTFISRTGARTSCPSSVLVQTWSTLRDMVRARSSTDFLWVHSSRSSPICSMNMMEPAVGNSFRAMATVIAVASRTGTSSFPRERHPMPRFRYPAAFRRIRTVRTGIGTNSRQNPRRTASMTSFSSYSRFSALPEGAGSGSSIRSNENPARARTTASRSPFRNRMTASAVRSKTAAFRTNACPASQLSSWSASRSDIRFIYKCTRILSPDS